MPRVCLDMSFRAQLLKESKINVLLLWRNAHLITMFTVAKTKCLELKYFVNAARECGVSLFVELKCVYLFSVCGKERQIEIRTQEDRLINTLFRFSLHKSNTVKNEGVPVKCFLLLSSWNICCLSLNGKDILLKGGLNELLVLWGYFPYSVVCVVQRLIISALSTGE